MKHLEIIYELDTIIFMADQLKSKALQVRKKLELEMAPVSPKGQVHKIQEKTMCRIHKRLKNIKEVNA